NLWMKDPPASSYPACIAVKCAEAQSLQIGDTYLRMLREAVMIDGKNISKQTVLIDIANELSKADHNFDLDAFKEDLKNEKGLEAFRNDMQQVRYHNINRFPTLILRRPQQSSMLITGYRPYIVLIEALKKISPNLRPLQIAETEEQYASHWTSILPREIQEGISKL
ncbi:MAG: DsbA family oxidoreductase, partial [Flavitalea sp.]